LFIKNEAVTSVVASDSLWL